MEVFLLGGNDKITAFSKQETKHPIGIKIGAALLLTGALVVSTAGCSLSESASSEEKKDTKPFEYSYEDQIATGVVPYQVKGTRQFIREGDGSIGKVRDLEKGYVFEEGKYYSYVIHPDQQQDLYVLSHNEAYDTAGLRELWNDIKDPEKTLMSTAYLKREFASVFPSEDCYAPYFNYIGNSNIFDASVDYQVLRSDGDRRNYYLLKTYTLTLKKQPSGVFPAWPVGESFKYSVFAKINLSLDGVAGYDIIAEQFEGIGSDTAQYEEGSVKLSEVLSPAKPVITRRLTKKSGE